MRANPLYREHLDRVFEKQVEGIRTRCPVNRDVIVDQGVELETIRKRRKLVDSEPAAQKSRGCKVTVHDGSTLR